MGKITEKQRKKRREIALKALPVISQYGFNNIHVTTLCQETGQSVGGFYHYFKDKNDIIMELFLLIDDYYQNFVEADVRADANKLRALRTYCLKYAYYSLSCGLEVCRQISLVPLLAYDSQFMSPSRYMYQLLHSILEEGQRLGQLTEEFSADALCDLVLITIRGYCFDWCKAGGQYDLAAAIDRHLSLLLRQLAVDPALCGEALGADIQPDADFDFYAQSAD